MDSTMNRAGSIMTTLRYDSWIGGGGEVVGGFAVIG